MAGIYLDNAATTALDPEVFEAMKPFMLSHFGNPSSIHSHGREVRAAIEKARRTIAELLNTSPSEIFFTSGGTEADNTAIRCSIEQKGIKKALTSKIEHHAVLHTLQHLEKAGQIELDYVPLDENGSIEMDALKDWLSKNPDSLVSLMHGNNEIGNIIDLEEISWLCKEHGAVFHSDTVQTMAHYTHDLQEIKAQHIVGAAHKFHGPKGVGFLYINGEHKIHPFIHGGAQERNMRGGTENVYGIVGLAKAMEIAYRDMEEHHNHIQGLKDRMIQKLQAKIEGVDFNGLSADQDKSLYTVLNVCLPPSNMSDMLLFNLDIKGISASGGSACSSGSDVGSHVIAELGKASERPNVRFSFSKYNTAEEIDKAVDAVAEIYEKKTVG
ncbi:cysteine desulfurase family protein [Marivirga sp.]|uniref:cysteine desulfurase family protein n=1 Tax=Marivirga sp. TaxID=2018662 RepID=UPI002D7FBA55|nr:cysteine desulfurase family protein [Marivirga sp.]HET8858771.1 cysteine desulfurase family protein [Marivirga sp.]